MHILVMVWMGEVLDWCIGGGELMSVQTTSALFKGQKHYFQKKFLSRFYNFIRNKSLCCYNDITSVMFDK